SKTTHARNIRAYIELAAALSAEILAGHNCVATAAQPKSDDHIRDPPRDPPLEVEFCSSLKEARCVMHQAVKATHSCQSRMQRWLIARHQGPRRLAVRGEVPPQRRDLFRCAHLRSQFDDVQRVFRVLRQPNVIDVRDDMVRDLMLMQPARERKHAPLSATHRLNLGEDDDARVRPQWDWNTFA